MDGFLARSPRIDPLENLILVVGAPRSGTTWLAKILDSHPDTLYRHEPDEVIASPATLDATEVLPLLRAWSLDRSLRTTTKRPFFQKSWQSPVQRMLRAGLAYGLSAATRVPGLRSVLRAATLGDFGNSDRARLVIKTVRWSEGVGTVARALPGSRVVVILRNPCGQIHSVMRGVQQRRFELRESGAMPLDQERAMAVAATYGVGDAEFLKLPPAAMYAWGWVAFNEAVVRTIADLPNVRVVLYEELCARPEAVSRDVLGFADLPWDHQTADFVARSSRGPGEGGYYDVFQNAAQAATRWRAELSTQDKAAIRDVVARTALATHWPDL